MAVVSAAYQRESVAQRPVMTAPMAYETAGLEAGLAAAVVLLAEARARVHMTTRRMLGDTALAGLAAAVVLLAEARAQPRARRNERIFLVLV